ncbi:XRE family transcriptional regulator [Anaerotignum faecicola]|nr:XRE family transcriptional regulator [Anaerotignum faecicola]
MLGKKIRETRKSKKLTLKDLSDATGLTSSYISQVEREIVDPSISSLRKISAALQVPMFTLLDDTEKHAVVVRVDQRRKVLFPKSNIVYEFLTPTSSSEIEPVALEIIEIKVKGKSWSRDDYSVHTNAEKCILMLSGSLIIDLGDENIELYKGDSIYIRQNIPHKAFNPNDEEATALICITPPSY